MKMKIKLSGICSGKSEMNPHRVWVTAFIFLILIPVCYTQSAFSQISQAKPDLEEIRLKMEKWIETQQIISKERKEWQQGKEILVGRIDPIKKELESIKEKILQAELSAQECNRKKEDLQVENETLRGIQLELTNGIGGVEGNIRKLFPQLPDPIKTRIQPLYQRIPQDTTQTHVSIAERYQNVLGILNELNKSNNEIIVNYEVHTLSDGKPSEVKVFYVGLAQAYYVSSRGEAGIGQPGPDSWNWEPSPTISLNVTKSLEIIQGKQTPEFIPLPVKIQ